MSWIGRLLKEGYNIVDIKKMQLSDIELMVKALETTPVEKKEEVIETTLDKAFPFLFG